MITMPTSTKDFVAFLDKYKGQPSVGGMEKFFRDDLMVSLKEEGSCDNADIFEKSGNLALLIETLEKLTSDEGWALVTNYESESMKMICLIPQLPKSWFILEDVKNFKKLSESADGYYSLINDTAGVSLHDMDDMPHKSVWGDISVGGVWFDSDDDWNYTYLSRFFQNLTDFNDKDTKTWLIQVSEPMMGELLNWMFNFYDSLFEIVGVKV